MRSQTPAFKMLMSAATQGAYGGCCDHTVAKGVALLAANGIDNVCKLRHVILKDEGLALVFQYSSTTPHGHMHSSL